MPAPDLNRVRLRGRLEGVRKRWTPDGSLAVIAWLLVTRPPLGAPRRGDAEEGQPLPLRAVGGPAGLLLDNEERQVYLEGTLRRRYYRREGEPCWGQVEIWVDLCRPEDHGSKGEESLT